ncbi:MAG: 4-hydroxybutyrate--acetyl-CoA CoA transferase, partial [Lachnospiraceae bacterium]|nr:4-hydroxybutyrate--acetyl-CoA CoA transferase [Lachnospiraceae bacterium]
MNINQLYDQKKMTAEAIAARVKPGMTIMSDIAAGAPPELIHEIGAYVFANKIPHVNMNGMLDLYLDESYTSPEAAGYLDYTSWFTSGTARGMVNAGLADVRPGYYHEMPGIIRDYTDIDWFIAAVSPMDSHGYFSLGLNGSLSAVLAEQAKHIYLEVNSNMPRCLHGPILHISQIDGFCRNDVPLPELPPTKISEKSETIGNLIAQEVPDGATIQLGIGGIPEAVGAALKEKKHLGIHTEMFTSSMVDLIECGAVDNSRKPLHRGRSVTTFAFGSKKIYDYVHDNPAIEILPVDYVNDPAVIAQHPDFISVNAAVEVDFYGQVCAESVGTRHLSGTGGQVDYVQGATRSRNGNSFIAFESTTKGDSVSKIRPTLTPGAI